MNRPRVVLTISIAGFLLGFYLVVLKQIGRFDTQVLVATTKHPDAMLQFMAEALGYSIGLPFLVTVLLAVSLINLSAAFSDGTIK